jgi:hypothetical protein
MIRRGCSWSGASAAFSGRPQQLFRWLVVVVAVLGAGCASLPGSLAKDSPAAVKEAAVAERAKARWDAVIKGDYKEAYEYFSPASRDALPLVRFEARGRQQVVRYRAASVQKVACEAEVCKVTILLTYDHAVMKGITTPLEETWLIEGGKAWMVYRG